MTATDDIETIRALLASVESAEGEAWDTKPALLALDRVAAQLKAAERVVWAFSGHQPHLLRLGESCHRCHALDSYESLVIRQRLGRRVEDSLRG